ncbi:hypothetical protein [Hymenobacter glacialis]|uniref:hypothetical protein n=1 Tax=Hymenobacter glacialis TaxID=1908236 RepID=UPI000AF78F37|nr:hypothetical protein [Hymenobacter glacialis]
MNNLTLQHLLQLAADTRAAASVRGQALLAIDGLEKWMSKEAKRGKAPQQANVLFGLSEIQRFRAEPGKFTPPPAVEMPPGAPIGMPAMGFLD